MCPLALDLVAGGRLFELLSFSLSVLFGENFFKRC